MQSKAVRMVRDEDRHCVACGYEGSPNAGPSDDLRYYETSLYHPICFEEVDYIVQLANEYSSPPDVVLSTLERLGINPDLVVAK